MHPTPESPLTNIGDIQTTELKHLVQIFNIPVTPPIQKPPITITAPVPRVVNYNTVPEHTTLFTPNGTPVPPLMVLISY